MSFLSLSLPSIYGVVSNFTRRNPEVLNQHLLYIGSICLNSRQCEQYRVDNWLDYWKHFMFSSLRFIIGKYEVEVAAVSLSLMKKALGVQEMLKKERMFSFAHATFPSVSP